LVDDFSLGLEGRHLVAPFYFKGNNSTFVIVILDEKQKTKLG